jgi:hypothetical protein
MWDVSIIAGADDIVLPADVMNYLKRHFNVMKMLVRPDVSMTFWRKAGKRR